MTDAPSDSCPLCDARTDHVIWQDDRCRVILVDDADYPGFCRVVWTKHVAEMTDLAAFDRQHVMNVVFATEATLRTLMNPHKMNVASLGNVVPHLHWHVIPRFRDDRHFPNPVWGQPQRHPTPRDAPDGKCIGAGIDRLLNV